MMVWDDDDGEGMVRGFLLRAQMVQFYGGGIQTPKYLILGVLAHFRRFGPYRNE